MKYTLALLTLVFFVIASCNKDKYTTIPQFELKSVSPTVVFNGNIVSLKGVYTDEEGDIDSAYIVYKWYNGAAVVRKDTFRYSITNFKLPANTRKAEMSVDFEYNTNNTGLVPLPAATARDTTASLGIILVDKGKNRSVYAESQHIRLKRP